MSDPLFGSDVARALTQVSERTSAFDRAKLLTRELGPHLGPRAAALLDLRLRSVRRHGADRLLFLTDRSLQQATPRPVAEARASRIRALLPASRIWDATCGAGSESLALRDADLPWVASDLDPFLARCTAENLHLAGAGFANVLVADARGRAVRADALLLDPDRRVDGRRSLDPRRWSPTLERALALAARHAGACLKLAPALEPGPWAEGPERLLSWVSLGRELVELGLWTGALARDAEAPREVVAIADDGTRAVLRGSPEEAAPLDPDAAAEVAWLSNPDPGLVRSGLLGRLAREQGQAPLGSRVAYLGGEGRPDSPFLETRRVLGSTKLDPKRVRRLLAAHDVGPVEVWKRGLPGPAEELQRKLKGKGSLRGTLAVARLDRGHRVFLLETPGGVQHPDASGSGTPHPA